MREARKSLKVDLSDRSYDLKQIRKKTIRRLGGGTALALDTFSEAGQSSDAGVVLAPGLLAGTYAPAAHWSAAAFFDPWTNQPAVSYFGGDWGAHLRLAGICLLHLTERAPSMTVLVIENDRIDFLDAGALGGFSPLRTHQELISLLGEGYHTVSIGPAGEREQPFASLLFDGVYQRASCGLGAQFGRMGLKAVAVKGTGMVSPASPEAFMNEARELRERFAQAHFPFRELSSHGSAHFLRAPYRDGLLPVNNYTTSILPGFDSLFEAYLDHASRGRFRACFGCPVGCRSSYRSEEGWREGVGYEEIVALGTLCGITDLQRVIEMKSYCDNVGMDPLAVGGLLACIMEADGACSEPGIRFGDAEKVLDFLKNGNFEAMFQETEPNSDSISSAPCTPSSLVGFMSTDPRGDLHMALHRLTWPLEETHLLGSCLFTSDLPLYQGRGKDLGAPEAAARYQNFALGLESLGFCPWTVLNMTEDDLNPILSAYLGGKVPRFVTSQFGRRANKLGGPVLEPTQFKDRSIQRFKKLFDRPVTDGPRQGERLNIESSLARYFEVAKSSSM
jgi:aldehyde:ferredoxin oxidoreductase